MRVMYRRKIRDIALQDHKKKKIFLVRHCVKIMHFFLSRVADPVPFSEEEGRDVDVRPHSASVVFSPHHWHNAQQL